MKKKLVAMMLMGSMLILVMTGCGGGNADNVENSASSAAAETEKTDLVVFAAASKRGIELRFFRHLEDSNSRRCGL